MELISIVLDSNYLWGTQYGETRRPQRRWRWYRKCINQGCFNSREVVYVKIDTLHFSKRIFYFLCHMWKKKWILFWYCYSLKHAPNGPTHKSRGFTQEEKCQPNTQIAQSLSLKEMLRETTSPVVGKTSSRTRLC